MIILGSVDEGKFDFNTVITIGNFDGVHIGHRLLINKTRDLAKKLNAKSLVFCFWPNTKKILYDNEFKCICDKYERRLVIKNLGIDYLFEFDFDCEIKKLTSKDFLDMLIKKFNCVGLVLGEDYKFGCDNSQKILCEFKNLNVQVIKKRWGISSSYIRNLILKKNFFLANKILCENYFVLKINTEINNKKLVFDVCEDKLLPPDGIYKTKILIENNFYICKTEIVNQKKIISKIFGLSDNLKLDFAKIVF